MPGMGTVALRPAAFRPNGLFQVDDYGADPTGVANSTAAVTAAITAAHAAGAAGCAIWFTPGKTYALNLTIDGIDDVCLLGYGVTLNSFSVANLDVLLLKGTSHTLNRFTMQGDWVINGPASGTGSCIHFNIATNSAASSIENVECIGGTHGLWSNASNGELAVRNLQIFSTRGEGVLIDGALSGAGRSGNCWIDHLQMSLTGQIGYRCRGGILHGLFNSDIEGCSQNIVVDPPTGTGVQDLNITNVAAAGATAGPNIKLGGDLGTVIGVNLVNIQASASAGVGIQVTKGASSVRITNPHINGCGASAIGIDDASVTDVRISGGTLGTAASPNGQGLGVSAAATDWGISDCSIGSNIVGVGISAVATDYYFVRGCTVHTNTTPIIDSGTGTHKEFGTHNTAQPGTNL